MAQLGVAGQESGGPIEHPVPAAVPRPADPITGQELNDDAHAILTGGMAKGDEAAQPDKSGLELAGSAQQDATDVAPPPADILQHPVPASVPKPVVPGSSDLLDDDAHALVTGGLSKGDEAAQPAPSGADAQLGRDDADDEDEAEDGDYSCQADEDFFARIEGMVKDQISRVLDRVKHLEHDIKHMRRKR
jgi:hypothetical protein